MDRGRAILNSALDYLYIEAQAARNAFERDAFSLALALIGAVKRGEHRPVDAASYQAFGGSLEKYRQRRAESEWRKHQDYLRSIPDYDPEADHGHQFFNLAAAPGARSNTRTTRASNATEENKHQPVRDRSATDRRDVASAI